MGGVTSPVGFPYPTGTDRVMDGDNAMQALAEAIDDYFVGSGAVPTLDSNVTNIGDGTVIFRRGMMVTLMLECQPNIVWSNAWPMVYVPLGYRPSHRVLFSVGTVNSTVSHLLNLTTNGNVTPVNNGIPAGTPLWGTCTYPAAM